MAACGSLPANAEKLFALVEQEGVLNTTVVLTGVAPSGAPAVARRRCREPDELEPQYVQPQYGQPQYGQPRYAQPQYDAYGRPVYGNPYYAQPQYRAVSTASPMWCSSPATCIAIPMATRIVQRARQHVSVPVSRHLADVRSDTVAARSAGQMRRQGAMRLCVIVHSGRGAGAVAAALLIAAIGFGSISAIARAKPAEGSARQKKAPLAKGPVQPLRKGAIGAPHV